MRQLPNALTLLPLSLLFLIPFVVWNHLPPIMSFYAEWWAGVLGLLVILLVAGDGGRWRPPRSGFAPLGLALLISIQVALGLTADLPLAFLAILYLLGGVALTIAVRLVACRVGSEVLVATLAWTLVAGGALSALFAVQQVWSLSQLLDEIVTTRGPNGATGNLSQANHLASYIGIGLASVSYLVMKSKLRMISAMLIGGWLVFALSLTGSRSAWLYLLVLVVLSVGWLYKRRSTESREIAFVAFAYIGGFVLFQWLLSDTSHVITASQRLADEGGGLEIRLVYWRHAFEMFLANPLLGVGYRSFAWENFVLVANDIEAGRTLPASLQLVAVNNAHNVFLHLLAEFGALGLLLIGPLVHWIVRQAVAFWSPERWWAWGVLSVLGVHSLLEFPLWYAYFWGVFAVALGVLEGPLPARGEGGRGSSKVLVVLIALMGLATLSILSIKYAVLERVFAYGPERNPAYTSSHLQLDFVSLQRIWIFDPWIAFAYSATPIQNGQSQAWPLQLHFNTIATRYWPNPGFLYRQVLLLGLNGETENAGTLLQKVGTVHPDGLPLFLRQAESFSLDRLGTHQFQKQL